MLDFALVYKHFRQILFTSTPRIICLILLHFTSICEESGCDAVRSINACFLLVLQAYQAFPVKFRSISARCANACFLLCLQAFPEPFTDLGSIPLPLEMLVFYWFYKHLDMNCDPRAHFLQNASNSTRFTSISSISHDSRPMPAEPGRVWPSPAPPTHSGPAWRSSARSGPARNSPVHHTWLPHLANLSTLI